jgi:hypothetical protein
MLPKLDELRPGPRPRSLRGGWLAAGARLSIRLILGFPLRQELVQVRGATGVSIGFSPRDRGTDFCQGQRPIQVIWVHERHDQRIGATPGSRHRFRRYQR